jgi:hypothetical protein
MSLEMLSLKDAQGRSEMQIRSTQFGGAIRMEACLGFQVEFSASQYSGRQNSRLLRCMLPGATVL